MSWSSRRVDSSPSTRKSNHSSCRSCPRRGPCTRDKSGRVERAGPVRRQHAQPLGVWRAVGLPLHEAEVCRQRSAAEGPAAKEGVVHFSTLVLSLSGFLGGAPRLEIRKPLDGAVTHATLAKQQPGNSADGAGNAGGRRRLRARGATPRTWPPPAPLPLCPYQCNVGRVAPRGRVTAHIETVGRTL